MIELPNDPGHITLYLISSLEIVSVPLGATIVPLRECREITTETGRMVGWYIHQTKLAVIRSGFFAGVLFILPNNERIIAPCSYLGLPTGDVQIGQLVELVDVRLLHKHAKPVQLQGVK